MAHWHYVRARIVKHLFFVNDRVLMATADFFCLRGRIHTDMVTGHTSFWKGREKTRRPQGDPGSFSFLPGWFTCQPARRPQWVSVKGLSLLEASENIFYGGPAVHAALIRAGGSNSFRYIN
jgi:hypothetical protein